MERSAGGSTMKLVEVNGNKYLLLEVEYQRLESIFRYTNDFDLEIVKNNATIKKSQVNELVEYLHTIVSSDLSAKLVNTLLNQSKNKYSFKCIR